MLHLRVVSPTASTPAVLALLTADPGTANLALLPGASLDPTGDLIFCDVAREAVNDVIAGLRRLDVHHAGSIAVENIDVSVSDAAAAAERNAKGYGSDAAVWEEVEDRVRNESALTAGYVAFIVVAALIAVVGLLEDSPILIVGAMVVGPEFGPISGLAVGIFKRRADRVQVAARTLAIGLTVGVVASFVATGLALVSGLVPAEFSPHEQPLTGFIVEPSVLSLVVALLAGVAGTLSLTQSKSGALIGVLISVTTIPAVAAMGVSAALVQPDNFVGATVQLAVNVAALLVAAVLTLVVQRAVWGRVLARRQR